MKKVPPGHATAKSGLRMNAKKSGQQKREVLYPNITWHYTTEMSCSQYVDKDDNGGLAVKRYFMAYAPIYPPKQATAEDGRLSFGWLTPRSVSPSP